MREVYVMVDVGYIMCLAAPQCLSCFEAIIMSGGKRSLSVVHGIKLLLLHFVSYHSFSAVVLNFGAHLNFDGDGLRYNGVEMFY